jgi:hypothetical protein
MNSLIRFATLVGCGLTASATAQTSTFTDLVPAAVQLIRDYDLSGLVRTLHVSGMPAAPRYDISVTLKIDPTANGTVLGDYYAYLYHADANGARSVVLLNRVGSSALYPAGYTDEAMNVAFRDDAVNGDIHAYRLTLGGAAEPPLNNPLSGSWQPDGRTESPFTVSYDSPRNQTLADFSTMSADGDWSLFIADVSFGGEGKLPEWTLSITPTPVPEPSTIGLLALGGSMAALGVWRRRQQLKNSR